jgi:hypothetical protein
MARRFGAALRLCATRAVCALALAGLFGCAQPPGKSSGLSAAEVSEEAKLALIRDSFSRDDVIERALGIARTSPKFGAVKSGYASLFSDELIGRWALREIEASGGGDAGKSKFLTQWTARMASGMNRLTDAQAMGLFTPMATMMERLDETQCRDYNDKSAPGGIQKLTRYMSGDEIVQFFDTIRLALRADLQKLPLRQALAREDVAATVKALTLATPAATPGGSTCQSAAGAFRAMDRLEGAQRSSAITMLLLMSGFAGQRAAATP